MVEWGHSEEEGPHPLIERDTVRIQWVYSKEKEEEEARVT